MPDPSLSASASLLRPFVTSVFRYARRLHAERQAGQVPLTQPSSIMDGLLSETLDRIRVDNIDSSWWQSLLDQFSQQYIAPEFLTKPALQEWLAEKTVASDLKEIATWRIMATAQDEAAPLDRLAQSYSNHTGEAPYLAARPIEVVIAILVAGYIGPIRADQRVIAGMLQTGISRIENHLERLNQTISPLTDPHVRKAHTEHATRELNRVLILREFGYARSRSDTRTLRSDIRKLQDRLTSGDLTVADCRIKRDILYWAARLCAIDTKTLNVAKELRTRIKEDHPDRELSIIDALISETDGDSTGAIQLLRDRDDPDSRTTLFGVLVRSHEAHTALEEFADRVNSADAGFFTSVGWITWALCMADVNRWQEAAERLATIDGTRAEPPALAFFEGIINAQLLLPVEIRSATASPQLFMGIRPNQGKQAETAHRRATICFELAQSGLLDIDDTHLERCIAEWRRWLRLMDPSDENARIAHHEIQQGLESDRPDVKLMPFASAFSISFNPEPLRRYLADREMRRGLNDDELQAECLLLLTAMNSEKQSARSFLDYMELRHARLARVMPNSLLNAARIDALVTDSQPERARALLNKIRSTVDASEASRLSAMIDAHEGLDPRKDLERTYRETGSTADLQNLIRWLQRTDDREALLPHLEKLMSLQRTVENARNLATCLSNSPFFNHTRVVEFLDSNSDLVEQSPQSQIHQSVGAVSCRPNVGCERSERSASERRRGLKYTCSRH